MQLLSDRGKCLRCECDENGALNPVWRWKRLFECGQTDMLWIVEDSLREAFRVTYFLGRGEWGGEMLFESDRFGQVHVTHMARRFSKRIGCCRSNNEAVRQLRRTAGRFGIKYKEEHE